jgi:hypothetical protein
MDGKTFLDDIAGDWHRAPRVFAAPSWATWATPELVLDALRGLGGATGVGWRLFAGEEPISRNHKDALIRDDEATLAEYLARLGAERALPGLIVNDIQAASPACWLSIAPLLSTLYSEYGTPFGGALVDLFLAGRSESFFGVHKDDQDVFMFVVAGCKRVELWRYETLAPVFGAAGYYASVHRGQVPVEQAPDLVFEVEAGDVAYWPAGYWHRVHNLAELTAGLSLGLFTRPDPLSLLARLEDFDVGVRGRHPSEPVHGRGVGPLGRCETDVDELLAAIASAPASREQLLAGMAAWKSSLGFRASPRRGRPEQLGEQEFRLLAPAVLQVVEFGERLLVGASGALARYPNDAGLVRVLAVLRRCAPTSVAALDRELCGGDPAWREVVDADRRALLSKMIGDFVEVCAVEMIDET